MKNASALVVRPSLGIRRNPSESVGFVGLVSHLQRRPAVDEGPQLLLLQRLHMEPGQPKGARTSRFAFLLGVCVSQVNQ